MKFSAIVNRLGNPAGWQHSIAAIRDQHGKGASRWLADRFNVSMRTAQRWLNGSQAPTERGGRREAVRRAADSNRVAANRLRNAHVIGVGKVKVRYGVKDQGMRNVGTLRIDDPLRAELDRAADAIERGDQGEAERIMSAAILAGYGAQRARDGRDVTRSTLEVDDYPEGLTLA